MLAKISEFTKVITTVPFLQTGVLSVLIFVIVLIIRTTLLSSVERKDLVASEKVYLKKKIKSYTQYAFFIVLFVLWFSELQVVFVSLIAIAAAIVIAFKELIMCLTGGLLIKGTKTFSVGDRIEVNNIRGFVVEKMLLTTKILEIGPERNSHQATGNIVTLPNSLMLSHPIMNESYFRGFSIKAFRFQVPDSQVIESFEATLLEQARRLCSAYLEEAKRGIESFCEREGILIPSIEPRTKILCEKPDEIVILLKMPVKTEKLGDTEQELRRTFVSLLNQFSKKEA